MTTVAAPSVADVVAGARAFLDEHAPKKVDGPAAGGATTSLFQEFDRAEVEETRAWRRLLFDAGLAWLTGPVEYGGAGLTAAHDRAVGELLRRYEVPSNRVLTVSLGMVAATVLAHGTDDLKERLLRRLHRGDLIGCQLFSEPDAGSDLSSVKADARRDGDAWMVSGQKVWTSGAHVSDIGLLLTRTSDGPRHRNLTMFIVEMSSPGVEVRPLRQMTGGAAFNEVFLDQVRVDDRNRIGEVGEGWGVTLTTLANERSAMGSSSFGGSGLLSTDRLVELVRRCGRQDDPVVRDQFARLLISLRVAKYNRLRSDANRLAGHRPGPEMAGAKLALGANIERLSRFVELVLGPAVVADTGQPGAYDYAQLILGVPGYRIGGGTEEIMRSVIAERVLALPKEPR